MDSTYSRLRSWRWQKALQLGVPGFFVLSNRHLAGIAAAMPTSAEALANCPGIGCKKLAQFGAELVELVSACAAEGLPPGVEVLGDLPAPEPNPATPSLTPDDLVAIGLELRRLVTQRLVKRFRGRYSPDQVEEALRHLLPGA